MTGFDVKAGAIGALVLVAATSWAGATLPAAAAENISSCDPGLRAVDDDGHIGTITGWNRYMCAITFDDGTQDSRMLFTIHPVDAPPVDASLASPVPDGTYNCVVSSGSFDRPNIIVMGQFDFQGENYRFRPFGNVTDDFAPYSVADGGAITWGGRVGGLQDAPSELVRSYRTDGGLNVEYRAQPTGFVDIMSCKPAQ